MASNRVQFPRLDLLTPVGRLVAGSVLTPNLTDMHGKPRDKPQYWFGLAVSKQDPAVNGLITQIMGHAWTSYQHVPAVAARLQQGLQAREFAWKIVDGDDPKYAGREGYAGSWVFGFGTVLPIRCANGENVQIDPATVKLGSYADVAFSIEINGKQDHTAGLYLNPACCRILGYGTVITPGPSINQLMGARPAALPPGASLVPVAPAGGAVPALPGMPAMPMMQPAQGIAYQAAPAMPGLLGGVTGNAPAFTPAMQPAAPVPPTPAPLPDAAAVAAQWGVQHHPGYRYNPTTNAYDPDAPTVPAMISGQFVTPSPVRPPTAAEIAIQYRVQHHEGYRYNPATNAYDADVPLPVAGPVAPAGAIAHPVQHTGAPSFPGTASPSSPTPPPGVSPHPQFLHGGAR